MDKNTLGHYGWVVITVIIISIMIALASPFAGALKGNFVGTVNDFGGRMDAALEGIGSDGGEGEKEEGPQMNEYGFYFDQPYQTEVQGTSMEFIFRENGSVIRYDGTTAYLPEGSCVYGTNSIESNILGLLDVSDDGTTISPGEGILLVLNKDTQYSRIQKGKVYKSSNGEELVFDDNSATYSTSTKSETADVEYVRDYIIFTGYNGTQFGGKILSNGTEMIMRDIIFTLQ